MNQVVFFRMETLDWLHSWPCKSLDAKGAALEAKRKARKEGRAIRLVIAGGISDGHLVGYFYR